MLGQNIKKENAVKSGQSTDDLYMPTWIFWSALQFLVPSMNARQRRDSMKSFVEIIDPSDDPQEPLKTPSVATKKQKLKHGVYTSQQELMNECMKVLKEPQDVSHSPGLIQTM